MLSVSTFIVVSARTMKFRSRPAVFALACAFILSAAAGARAQVAAPAARIAVLDLGATEGGRRAADELSAALAKTPHFHLVNRSQARVAARGVGYEGSLNLTLDAARDLGAAIGCDLYFTGEADTLRRTSTLRPDYFESYASLFLVSAQTGRLVLWEHFAAESAAPEEAEKSLFAELRTRAARYVEAIGKAQAGERSERLLAARAGDSTAAGVFEDVPEEGTPAAENFRAPQPYRSLRPVYPATAARASAEATVDALVEVDAAGEVKDIEIVRWAGYGLNEAVIATVRQLHFRPAARDGRPVPVRVLLRYNFRRPKEEGQR
jgi:TonB family protein